MNKPLSLRSCRTATVCAPCSAGPANTTTPSPMAWTGVPSGVLNSTMGGNFQQDQGVEFKKPHGTPGHAIRDGGVRVAGPAEQGAKTVAGPHHVGRAAWRGRGEIF